MDFFIPTHTKTPSVNSLLKGIPYNQNALYRTQCCYDGRRTGDPPPYSFFAVASKKRNLACAISHSNHNSLFVASKSLLDSNLMFAFARSSSSSWLNCASNQSKTQDTDINTNDSALAHQSKICVANFCLSLVVR